MKRVFPLLALVLLAVPAFGQQPQPNAQAASIQADKKKLEALDKKYTAAKAAYGKRKDDAAARKAYVSATNDYGDAVLVAKSLTPKDKYPKALRLYREVLTVDPKNKHALENKKLIEDIYRSMNRPIPK
ncbi:MAG: hypothetical protein KIT11_01055 [Fimbriimonadaceae bacterium]|nr:hypothetical protein [Fimbriimonadaceae bacterium]QYK55038.1 MAG: hypothetical protein KF733_08480 [Fimbriimonadaceae bacterium]